MTRAPRVKHEFVQFVPKRTEEGTLYVSMEYATASHLCPCGCGGKVVTPITPTDWSLTYDGETISLYPSVGNWNFPCRSHYWIRRNQIAWAASWSREEIARGRVRDAERKQAFHEKNTVTRSGRHEGRIDERVRDPSDSRPPHSSSMARWWSRVKTTISRDR